VKAIAGIREVTRDGEEAFEQLRRSIEGFGRGATEALVDMITKGKADFKGFADSIIRDILRIAVQRQLIDPLLESIFGPPGGKGQGLGGLLKSVGSWISSAAGGGTEGATAASMRAGAASGPTFVVSPTINIDAATDRAQVARLVDQGVSAAVARVQDQYRRGGGSMAG
jgi:phage-related minor tail protein